MGACTTAIKTYTSPSLSHNGNATEEVSWVGAGLEPQDQLIHHGSRFSTREETLPLTPPPLPPPPFQRNYQKPFPNFQIRKLSIESSFENCNQFGELETLERRRRRRRCRLTDTLLAIPHHLLKKTPCYAILAAGSPWIFHPIKAIVSQLLCSCDVVLLIVTGWLNHGGHLTPAMWLIALGSMIQWFQLSTSAVRCECGDAPLDHVSLPYKVDMWHPKAIIELTFHATWQSWTLVPTSCFIVLQMMMGYYVFSQKLKHVVRLPFATTAYGTAAMLLVMVWRPHISILSITVLLRIIMLIEVVCAGFFMSVYVGYIHQYNSLDSHPDVLKSLYSPLQPSSSLEGLRYHDGGRLADQQMALLQYQRENLHFLSEEMNQLQSELSLARSLIAERDSEIQRVRTTNNQSSAFIENFDFLIAKEARPSVFLKMAFGDGLATHFVGIWLPSGEDNQFVDCQD
ncbi:hypothetical protein TEA_008042 [Camellia sinensis var. sinensis]|uniref:Uncharacterized protein n=1 Tax=Camellia sinensis var. sinensis TaxID=542762 RepID=A0A4S4DHA8_CAMSN|nr:hypothetical protein TEA_008042 [Camellia sinensis var. sinensis]